MKHDTVQISLRSPELVMAACLEQAAAGHSPDRQTRRLRSGTVLETEGGGVEAGEVSGDTKSPETRGRCGGPVARSS